MQSHRARHIGLFLYPFSAGVSAPFILAVLHKSCTVTSRAVINPKCDGKNTNSREKIKKEQKDDGIIWQKETFA